jgi:hypothetical protein
VARRSLILLVIGLVAAAGCFGGDPAPPPPPRPAQLCGLSFGRAEDYQSAYFGLGHANTGWITADGFAPVSLPDGSTAWWMSDTMTGTANPDNSVSNVGNVHNSVVTQGGGCLTPRFSIPAVIPETGGAWYWPGSSIVQGNTMLVFAYKVAPASGPAGFNWQILGTAVARFSVPSLQLVSGPTDMPTNTSPFPGGAIPWGIRSMLNPADGKVYLYGTTRRSGIGPSDIWAARAPFDQVTNQSQWEFSTGLPEPAPGLPAPDPAWTSQFALAQPMTFTGNDSPLAQFSVVPYGNRYLAGAARADAFKTNGETSMRAWIADSPQGPWQTLGDVTTFHEKTPDQIAYDARIVKLPGAGWTVVYSVNDPIRQQQNFTLYGGQFVAPNAGVLPQPLP